MAAAGRLLERIGDADQAREPAVDRYRHHRLAGGAARVRGGRNGARHRKRRHHPVVAECHLPAVDGATHPHSRHGLEIGRRRRRDAARLGAADDRLCERMLRAALQARRQPQQLGLVHPRLGDDSDELRPAERQGSGLVHDEGIDRRQPFEGLGVTHEHARLGPAPRRRHHRHRRRQPERAGAGDDQHRDRRDQPVGERRRRPPDRPGDEGDRGDGDNRRDEPGRHRIRDALDRRARSLRARHHRDDLREDGVGTDPARLDDQASAPVERRAGHRVAGPLFHRQRLAGQHRLVDRRASRDDASIDGHLLSRPHPKPVADLHRLEGDLLLASVGAQDQRRRWRQVHQRPDGGAGPVAGAKLEDLAEEHQHDDDGRGLEIDPDLSAVPLEGVGENLRRHHRDDAEAVGGGDADRDQAEHVEPHRAERGPSPLEEGPSAPEDDRRCEQQFEPARDAGAEPVADRQPDHRTHRHENERNGQQRAHRKTPPEVDKLRVRALVARRHALGLERHPADRATPRTDLFDLGMHRAGVDRPRRHRRAVIGRRVAEIARRIGFEPRAAARRAEIAGGPAHAGRNAWRWRDRRSMPQTGSVAVR